LAEGEWWRASAIGEGAELRKLEERGAGLEGRALGSLLLGALEALA
jgi:hypothetical protein